MPDTSKRVLFLAPFEPWCRENGSSLITADLLEGLSGTSGADILTVFLRSPPRDDCTPPPDRFPARTLGVGGVPAWLSIFRSMLTGRSVLHLRFANTPVTKRVLDVVAEHGFRPDIVHVEHLPLVEIGRLVAEKLGCSLVYRAHNIESELWSRRLPATMPLRALFLRRIERGEVGAFASADLSLCISEFDLEWARERAPSAKVEVLPGCLLFSRYRDGLRSSASSGQIGFVGGLEWGPNRTGLRWFVEEVLPMVSESLPSVYLAVLARGAEDCPWLVENPAVRILPPATSPISVFASSAMSIAPLLQGGGVRIKILESLAVGCPVVATRIGGEGLTLKGLTTVQSAEAFASACVELAQQPRDLQARRELASDVEELHGAHTVARRLVAAWATVRASAY